MNGHRPGPGCGQASTLWPRHAAGGIVGPVAVEPDHAPFDTPAHPEPAGVLRDRVMDRVLGAIGSVGDAVAEAARDRLRGAGPGPEGDLADTVDSQDLQVRGPELAFLVRELGMNLDQHAAVVAKRHKRIVERAGEP